MSFRKRLTLIQTSSLYPYSNPVTIDNDVTYNIMLCKVTIREPSEYHFVVLLAALIGKKLHRFAWEATNDHVCAKRIFPNIEAPPPVPLL